MITERMRRGRQSKLRAGTMLPWTRAPYGYRLSPDQPRDPRGVRVQESEAVQVAAIYARYLEPGQTLGKLARHLMGLGVPTPGGKSRWNTSTLRNLLSNPAYTGTLYANRVRMVQAKGRRSALEPIGQRATPTCVPVPQEEWIVVGHIPALVSVEHFEQVQAKLVHNQACASRHNTAQSYLLRALISCGACAHACFGRTQGPYSYYVCRTKQQHGVDSHCDQRCRAPLIPSKQLDELVWEDLCALIQQPEIIAQALQQAQGGAWLPQEWQARKKSVRQAMSQLHGQMERLTEAYVAGVLPLAEYRRRRQDVQERLRAVDNQARLLEAQLSQQRDLTVLADSISAFCQQVSTGLEHASFEQQRHLVELLIDRVVLTGNQVEIRYVIPTSPHGEQVRFCHLRTDYFGTVGTRFFGVGWIERL